jgi:hypothetical protein
MGSQRVCSGGRDEDSDEHSHMDIQSWQSLDTNIMNSYKTKYSMPCPLDIPNATHIRLTVQYWACSYNFQHDGVVVSVTI